MGTERYAEHRCEGCLQFGNRQVESAPIKKTNIPIVFTLTTGRNLTGKDVRVLHVLDSNGSTEVANSTVKDAAYGVVGVTASSFSPLYYPCEG